jgi:hypothetical protein
MTAVVGIVAQSRTVYMGADSAGVGGWDLTIRRDPKIFKVGPFLIGFTTSFRMGQLLQYGLPYRTDENPADQSWAGLARSDPMRFMCTQFVPDARKVLRDGGWSKEHDKQDEGGQFLVGFNGHLFRVESDFQVGESSAGFDAVGCGGQVACGSLHTSGKMVPEINTQKRLTFALEAAESLSAGVRGPFVIDSTPSWDWRDR